MPVVEAEPGNSLVLVEPTAATRYAAQVRWAVRAMDERFTPESAAEKVLEMVDDEPRAFHGMPGVNRLSELVEAARRAEDPATARAAVRDFLAGLAERLPQQ